jgi:hypothetical protein
MCPSIDTQIFCGGKGAFKYKERKKNLEVLYDYMMHHPTYAYPSSIPNPL